jgi:hypothetical protein
VWPSIATCAVRDNGLSPGTIDQINNPKGPAFATWMVNVGGSQSFGVIATTEPTNTCTAVDTTRVERWVVQGADLPQMFQFTTPNENAADQRCGKVVFSDMHVSQDSSSTPSVPFPNGCAMTPLTAQEKALAFTFFDIAACVGPIN